MSEMDTANLALTNDDMGEPPDALKPEPSQDELDDALRLWELDEHYTEKELWDAYIRKLEIRIHTELKDEGRI